MMGLRSPSFRKNFTIRFFYLGLLEEPKELYLCLSPKHKSWQKKWPLGTQKQHIYIYMLHRKNDIPTMLGFKFNLFRATKILFLCNSSCFVPTLGVRC